VFRSEAPWARGNELDATFRRVRGPVTVNMNAEMLTIRRKTQDQGGPNPVAFDGQFLSSRIGVRLREQRCPSCNSVVYTRRHTRCGVCEQALPESFLFTSDEAEKVDSLLSAERQRHRAWLKRVGAFRQ